MEYGLIGEKLGHSFSKEIHGMIGDYSYELKEIAKPDLTAFMQEKAFKGINVTIPYKQDVIPFLNSIDKAAEEIGAVNTITNKNGKLSGYNTDFIGLQRLILSQKLELKGKKVLILGTGGTSRTATAAANALGAKEILIVSRSVKADDDKKASASKPAVISYEQAATIHNDCQIIINTTPCGMFPKIDDSPLDLTPFTKLEGLIDVIYNPLRTNLVLQTQEKNVIAAGGLYMLVQQAIAAYEYFSDNQCSLEKAEKIYNTILRQKQNIVLVGMPGCGKSTLGKKLAASLNREFFDTDILIKQKEGMSPAEIIKTKGEPAFRDIEASVCKELSSKQGVIIATGGGAVLRKENVLNLKKNGLVFFIDRSTSFIKPTDDRPLSDSKDKLEQLYKTRYPVYTSAADCHIISDNNIEHTIEKILEAL